MSLDISLKIPGSNNKNNGTGVFIRENGCTREISREEWNEKYPNIEPIAIKMDNKNDEVYNANITHNLNTMADRAGIYKYLWRPDEIGIKYADQLIKPLTNGLVTLKADPKKFKKYNPPNGWGTYNLLVHFVENYLEACKKYPTAEVYADI
ncbi:MAG: hypothetical protein ACTSX6_08185 [Candidatus Heimdallarchaeaceae archaeon]